MQITNKEIVDWKRFSSVYPQRDIVDLDEPLCFLKIKICFARSIYIFYGKSKKIKKFTEILMTVSWMGWALDICLTKNYNADSLDQKTFSTIFHIPCRPLSVNIPDCYWNRLSFLKRNQRNSSIYCLVAFYVGNRYMLHSIIKVYSVKKWGGGGDFLFSKSVISPLENH